MIFLALLACDADHDGFRGSDDCDDSDPTAHPGAPDLPGDGIDSDCDGADDLYRYVGTWSLLTLSAEFAGIQAIVPGSAVGTLTVREDGPGSTSMSVPLDPDIAPITIPLVTDAVHISPVPGPDAFQLAISEVLLDEPITIDWRCDVELANDPADDLLTCRGPLLALGVNLDARSTYELR